jgi:hypothetical protein
MKRMRSLAHSTLKILVFATIGLLFAEHVVGLRVLNPLDVSWLGDDPAIGYHNPAAGYYDPATGYYDPATAYLGWWFFRNQDHFSFPIAMAANLGYPLGEPIAYLDSMPIVAAALWPIRHFLPEPFQYTGAIFGLEVILQLYFGYRISCRVGGGSRVVGFLGGLFFMIAPSFVWRATAHFALANQWLILAALDLYLRVEDRLSKADMLSACAIAFIAGGINPYIELMVLMIVAATALKSVLTGEKRLAPAVALLGLSVVSAVLALTLFGVIRPGEGGYAGVGYGYYSMNLLSPIDPEGYPSLLLPKQNIIAGQYEGYNYLGLGLILLGLFSLLRTPPLILRSFNSRTVGLWVVVACSTVLALSTKAFFGTHLLFSIHLPSSIEEGLSAFRGSGRLFWPSVYIIISCSIAASVVAFERWAPVVLLALLLVQFRDLEGLYREIRRSHDAATSDFFTDGPIWQALGKDYRHLVVIPAWQCSFVQTPAGYPGFWIFGKLAAQYNMTINSLYAARNSPRQLAFFCEKQPEQIAAEGLQPDAAYVFAQPSSAVDLALTDHFCQVLDGVTLCAKVAGKQGLDNSVVEAISLVDRDHPIVPGNPATSESVFRSGWSDYETWGRWTDGVKATIAIRSGERLQDDVALNLLIQPFSPNGRPQRLNIQANGISMGSFTLSQRTQLSISVPHSVVGALGLIVLAFQVPDAISPLSVGAGADPRKLGIGLLEISTK